jgi:FkbM family methyltransferase
MSILDGIRSHYRMFGLRGVLFVARSRLLGKQYGIQVVTQGITHPIHLRLRTSDVSVFEEVILNSEYEIKYAADRPKIIIDAGANIGLTAVFFANRFPEARIIAIEPEPSNFEVLLKNVAEYPNIMPVRAALWGEDACISLIDPGVGSWGFRASKNTAPCAEKDSTQGLTMNSILTKYQIDHIDILKIDIEGSEKEVFEHAEDWIDRVDVIMVELHDRFKEGCSQSVYSATRGFPDRWRKGETVFLSAPRGRSRQDLSDSLMEATVDCFYPLAKNRHRSIIISATV